MPSFVYRASDSSGRLIDGEISGNSESDAVLELERRDLTALSMKRTRSRSEGADAGGSGGGESASRIRLKPGVVLDFTRQLKVLLANGATVTEIFRLLRRRAQGDYGTFLEQVVADIQRGCERRQ